jgi:hypothetical protein
MRYAAGYRLFVWNRGVDVVLHVQRELSEQSLRSLARDLEAVSGDFVRARYLTVYLDLPLSAALSTRLSDVTQRCELLAVVSIPAIASAPQMPLADELVKPPTNRWLQVVPRPAGAAL